MKKILSACLLIVVLAVATPYSQAFASTTTSSSIDATTAWQQLVAGNKRFINDAMQEVDSYAKLRQTTALGQKPFVVVVTCSDSRVPPELIFDQHIGDVFVVRTAGEVVDDVALGSVEYGVEHLGARLVVVMGHTECGAVKAVLQGGNVPVHISAITKLIAPAQVGNDLMASIIANAKLQAQIITTQGTDFAKINGLKIMAVLYDINSGKVQIIE